MRYLRLSLAIVMLAGACSREHRDQGAPTPVGFLDKVWAVVESPGGPGDTYIFLSEGTFIRASHGGAPDIGRWGWDGRELTVIWDELPYTVAIDSLTDPYLKLTFTTMNQSFAVGLTPAPASLPDTTHTVEFNPAHASITGYGHAPAWVLQIEGERATLQMGKSETTYGHGEWVQECAAVWDFDAYREQNGVRDTIEMQLSTESHVDSTTGAEYPLTAVLQFNNRMLFGGAVAGKLPSH